MKIAVSILKTKYDEQKTIDMLNKTSTDYLHLDVTDGKFVEGITPDRLFLHKCTKPIQVHLMVQNPLSFISKYNSLNTVSFIIPSEIKEDIPSLLKYIKSQGKKCGLSLNPETKVEEILPYIRELDNIIIMSVKPGKGGQQMMEEVLYKIDKLIEIRKERNLELEIICDGGVNADTIGKVKTCDIVVAGSFICMSDDFEKQIEKLKIINK